MSKEQKDLVINEWYKGIGLSPHSGFADIRNLDVFSKPGSVQLNWQLQSATPAASSGTFTADAATDIVTYTTGLRYNNHSASLRAVTLTTTGTLPAGLSPATVYYVIDVTISTLKLATTLDNAIANTAIDITDAGSGTHTLTSVDPGLINYTVFDVTNSVYYGLDVNQRVWEFSTGNSDLRLITGNTLTSAAGNGIAIYKNYLFVFRNAAIDCWGSLTSARASRTWAALTGVTLKAGASSGQAHPARLGQDNILYWGDKDNTTNIPYVGSLSDGTGTFAPGTGSTFTANTAALDLPLHHDITGLEELGINLMIGTNKRFIYPWNRTDNSFDFPVITAEGNVTAMKTIGNILYFACGSRGNIYATVGSATKMLKSVPISVTSVPASSSGGTITATINSLEAHKGRLFFALNCIGCSGVYSINLETGTLILEHLVSNGSYGSTNAMSIQALTSIAAEQLFVSWKNNDTSVNGADITAMATNYYRQPSYGGYLESELFHVGTPLGKRAFNQLEFYLATPLVTGGGVRFSYRTDLTEAYSTTQTVDFATQGAVQNLNIPFGVPETEFVQLKVELTTGASSPTTPELREVRLR